MKELIEISMSQHQPDCCEECSLVGVLRKSERTKGDKNPMCCILTGKAMTERLSRSKASEHDARHPLKRPCDKSYAELFGDGEKYFSMDWEKYLSYRTPFLAKLDLRILREGIKAYSKMLADQGKPKNEFLSYLIKAYREMKAINKDL